MEFNQLKNKHRQFVYKSFQIVQAGEDLKVIFDFEISPDIKFKPEIVLPAVLQGFDKNILNNLVFNLGMVEMLSYWKATCSPEIIIKASYLDAEQIEFWKKLLIKGLGEFFYNNQIDFTQKDLVKFVILSDNEGSNFSENDLLMKNRDLILIGGGKDSAVTLDLISNSGKEFNCLLLNPTKAALKITDASGCENPIIIRRSIDPKLLELNSQGYLNGHTPFSAYLAFLSVLVGFLYNYKNILVSNESSSIEENVVWHGEKINHQYSKSEEFEQDFKIYCQNYLVPINYYSYLRDLNELKISEKFAKLTKYHKLFRSCNRGSKEGVWCGKCPKCVSTYLTLYPYLGQETKEIFGKDLLEDENLIPIVQGLLRENDIVKPFECVATVEEIKTAISLGIERAKKDGQKIPKLLKIYET